MENVYRVLFVGLVLHVEMHQCDQLLGQWLQMSQDRCVLFSTTSENWKHAREVCQQQGGDILSMRSLEELNWVSQMMDSYMVGLYKLHFWIGLKRGNGSDVNFHWADGSTNMDAANHLQWFSDQPNYRPHLCTPDDCVEYGQLWYSFFGAWDTSCVWRERYICSKDQCTDGLDPRTVLCSDDGLLQQRVCVHFRTRHQFIYEDAVMKCQGMMRPGHKVHTFSDEDLTQFASWIGSMGLSTNMWLVMENADLSQGCPYLRNNQLMRNGTCNDQKNYVCPQPYMEFWASSEKDKTGSSLPPLGAATACGQRGHPLKNKNAGPFYILFFILGAIVAALCCVGVMKFLPQIRNILPAGGTSGQSKTSASATTPTDPGFSNPTYD